jgi:hypothetical protein
MFYCISNLHEEDLMNNVGLSGVINAMISKHTNVMAERINGKIQEIKTSGSGYRTFQNFRSAILFVHGGLQLYSIKW